MLDRPPSQTTIGTHGVLHRRSLLLLAAVLLAACSSTHAGTRSAMTTGSSTSSSTAPKATTSTGVVITEHLALVDPSRSVISGGIERSSQRSLPTTVVRPAEPGRYPLVLVLPGYDVGPETYARIMTWLARHNVVVAAPSFPLADPAQRLGLDRADLPNEATDVSYVLGQLEAGPEARHIDPSNVAVLGHSDGADVALELGYDPTLHDPRIRSIIAVAPDPVAGALISGGPTLLLIHGSADEIVDPAASARVFAAVSAQRFSVTLLGADHASDIIGPSQWTRSFDRAVLAITQRRAAEPPSNRGDLGCWPLGVEGAVALDLLRGESSASQDLAQVHHMLLGELAVARAPQERCLLADGHLKRSVRGFPGLAQLGEQ